MLFLSKNWHNVIITRPGQFGICRIENQFEKESFFEILKFLTFFCCFNVVFNSLFDISVYCVCDFPYQWFLAKHWYLLTCWFLMYKGVLIALLIANLIVIWIHISQPCAIVGIISIWLFRVGFPCPISCLVLLFTLLTCSLNTVSSVQVLRAAGFLLLLSFKSTAMISWLFILIFQLWNYRCSIWRSSSCDFCSSIRLCHQRIVLFCSVSALVCHTYAD